MNWYFLPRVLSAGMTVIVLMVLTRLIGAADFGRYSVILVTGTTGHTLISAWMVAALVRFHSAPEHGERTQAMILGCTFVLLVTVLPIALLLYAILPDGRGLAVLMVAVFGASHAVHEIGLAGLQIMKERKLYTAVALFRPVIGVTLAVSLVATGMGYSAAVLGMALGAALSGGIALRKMMQHSRPTLPSLRSLRTFLTFGVPLGIVASSGMILLLVMQYLLAQFVGLEAVGYFAAAQTIAQRTIVLPMTSLTRSNEVVIFGAHERGGRTESAEHIKRHFSFLVFLALPFVMLLATASNSVAAVLFDEAFAQNVAGFLPLLAVAALATGLQGNFFALPFTLSRRTDLQFLASAMTLALHLPFSLAAIVFLGGSGAGVGMVMSAFLGITIFFVIGRRLEPVFLPRVEIGAALVGSAVLGLFGMLASASAAVPLFFLCIVAGFALYVALLAWLGQQAALEAVRHLGRVLGRFHSGRSG
ncbi:MAG: lipopolysaccharide biosynthesis protein [Rhodobacteraceae bacterium]|nr:lipopolysaccharide biosynthesis protein [Paracoccaceae bacterium]